MVDSAGFVNRNRKYVVGSNPTSGSPGEVSEWFKEHAWKACVPKGTAGSNPVLSAKKWGYMYQGFGEFDLQSDCGGFDSH